MPLLKRPLLLAGAAVSVFAIAVAGTLHAQSTGLAAPRLLPSPKMDATQAHAPAGLQTAVFSGGCFWGVQGVFEHVRGVQKAVSGYSGGAQMTANYELVSTGTTGHAESVKVTYDPRQISYGELLRIFFSVATDPTQVGGQFPDHGSQYRTDVFYTTPAQASTARAYIAQLNSEKAYARPIVTRVDADHGFYPAERYHQDYLVLNPDQPYISTYDLPKVKALKVLFPNNYKIHPVTVTNVSSL